MKVIAVIILIISLWSTVLLNEEKSPEKYRIVGGELCTSIKGANTKFMVGLTTSTGAMFCGGSLLTSNWVLTAAHCMDSKSIFVIHSKNWDECLHNRLKVQRTCMLLRVTKYLTHPRFKKDGLINDIGLLRLSSPIFRDRYVDYVKIPLLNGSEVAEVYPVAIVMGWGKIKTEAKQMSRELKCAVMKIMPTTECNKIINLVQPDTQVCTEPDNTTDACVGDSGGPLVSGRTQIGIVSWGINCADKYPGVYTRVDKYYSFIFKSQRIGSAGVRIRCLMILRLVTFLLFVFTV